MSKPTLRLICGCPGSGKSTYAKKLEKFGCTTLSSDAIRLELFGDENYQKANDVVFETLYERAKELLQAGENVVIDATNINLKSRRKALSHFTKLDIIRECVVICTPIEQILKNDLNRARKVGPEVIWSYIKAFECPVKEEGFDKVLFYFGFPGSLYSLANLLESVKDKDQNNPHHTLTLRDHCIAAQQEYLQETDNPDINIANALLYHDLGKLFTETKDDNGISHYYAHHNVGGYLSICSKELANKTITLETVQLINYHMFPYFWKEQKTEQKYRQRLGNNFVEKLLKMHEFDIKAH